MREMHLRVFAVAIAATLLLVTAYAQQSHWSSADDFNRKIHHRDGAQVG